MSCTRCEAVPKTREDRVFEHVLSLYDSSHYDLDLVRCPHCGQLFLHRFKEIVDWTGGDDDMWTHWAPLTEEEAAALRRMFAADSREREAFALAEDLLRRRRLVWHPDGHFYWSDDGVDASDLLPPG